MKTLFTPLVKHIGAKQITIVVALMGTVFLVVQASSTPRIRSTTIDDYSASAHLPAVGTGGLPASDAGRTIGAAGQSSSAANEVAFGATKAHSPLSASNPSFLASQSMGFASGGQHSRPAPSVTGVGAPVKQSFSSSSIAGVNGTSAGPTGSAGFGAAGGAGGSSAPVSTEAVTSRTDSPSILQNPVASTALSNTNDSLASFATNGNRQSDQVFQNPLMESATRRESGDDLAANPLGFSTGMAENTLDLLGMTVSDLVPSKLSIGDNEITPVASVPEAGHTLWLLSAAMVGLMAYGQRFSSRRNAA